MNFYCTKCRKEVSAEAARKHKKLGGVYIMISCRHVTCHQCDDATAKAYREILIDVAKKIDKSSCLLADLPSLVEKALEDKYAKGCDDSCWDDS